MTLTLNEKIYPMSAVKSAVRSYEEFADFSVASKNGRIFVNIVNIGEEFRQNLKSEFLNFLLGAAVQSKTQ